MKVAILSESEADEAAIRVLVEGLLKRQIEPPTHMLPIRARGYGAVFKVLPTILKHLHFRTDAEGLVVVLDSDRTPVHQRAHDQPGNTDEKCRLCRLKMIATQVLSQLPTRPGYGVRPPRTPPARAESALAQPLRSSRRAPHRKP